MSRKYRLWNIWQNCTYTSQCFSKAIYIIVIVVVVVIIIIIVIIIIVIIIIIHFIIIIIITIIIIMIIIIIVIVIITIFIIAVIIIIIVIMYTYFVDIFDELLSVFRTKYSCQSLLTKLGVYGLSEAFDCIPHSLSIAKLHAYGLSLHACIFF